ncbi:phospholipase [Thermococcus siculi]|uniref:Phospholipase n=1 Tax=Thermococcus siculi TaxID=72803 RepID=A0A2Z2N065_9EURY|nr:phospholipase [Thermococcus siculi]
MVISAGCLGGTARETVTLPGETITVTKTKTETTTRYIENTSRLEVLERNLTACSERLMTVERALNATQQTMAELREKYRECLTGGTQTGSSPVTGGEGYTVTVLEEREYYTNLIKAIDSSKSEIYVMMFLMKYDPGDGYDPANDLIRALVKARQRGVRVHVLLEDGIDENRKAYDYLRANGVDVTFDSPSTTLHAKVVVIDGKTVFIGSHNWSEAALDWNHEVSVRIDSRKLAEEMVDYFKRVRGR